MNRNSFAGLRQFVRTIRSGEWTQPQQMAGADQLEVVDELVRLKNELAETEYFYGQHLVRQHRYLVKSRSKTIAKKHWYTARNKTCAEWVSEAKALTRYFSKNGENDSEAANTLLMPFESQYHRARVEQISGKRGSQPTVGE